MKVCLLMFQFTCLVIFHVDCRSLHTLEDNDRQKRSDDPSPLQAVVDQLVTKVTTLEAQRSADAAKITALQAQVNGKRCETGRLSLRPHNQPEVSSGDYHERRHTVHVSFSHPFTSTPWVSVSLVELDDDGGRVRINAGFSGVSTSGFDAYANEWNDTHMYSVAITWIACSV